MSEATGKHVITPTMASAARELMLANIDLSRIAAAKVDDDPSDTLLVGMVAYGGLLLSITQKLGMDLNTALNAAEAVLSGRIPTLERVH